MNAMAVMNLWITTSSFPLNWSRMASARAPSEPKKARPVAMPGRV
jgi:hypothetical protein